MANWATLFTQRTKLPVASDPIAELFHCSRFACKITRTGCSNRFELAQGSTREGLSDQAVTYGACRRCPVGLAHSRQEPTPQDQFVPFPEDGRMTEQQEPKTWPERKCRTGGHMFAPASAAERSCADCRAKVASGGKVAAKPAAKPAKRPQREPTVNAAPKHGAVPKGIVELEEWLELGGFKARIIHTRTGQFLQVS